MLPRLDPSSSCKSRARRSRWRSRSKTRLRRPRHENKPAIKTIPLAPPTLAVTSACSARVNRRLRRRTIWSRSFSKTRRSSSFRNQSGSSNTSPPLDCPSVNPERLHSSFSNESPANTGAPLATLTSPAYAWSSPSAKVKSPVRSRRRVAVARTYLTGLGGPGKHCRFWPGDCSETVVWSWIITGLSKLSFSAASILKRLGNP